MGTRERIATIKGTFLAPGVSRNGRKYTVENISDAVRRAQAAISSGGLPLTMMTGHPQPGQTEDVTAIAGAVRDVWQEADGSASFAADIADTAKGRDVVALTSGKQPFLTSVSIRGSWVGDVRQETTETGQSVETADGLEVVGIDFTRSPGVAQARIGAVSVMESVVPSFQVQGASPATVPATTRPWEVVLEGDVRTSHNQETSMGDTTSASQTGAQETSVTADAAVTEGATTSQPDLAAALASIAEGITAIRQQLTESATPKAPENPVAEAQPAKTLAELVAEAVAAERESLKAQVKAEIVAEARADLMGTRKGVVTDGQSAPAKSVAEMSVDEISRRIAESEAAEMARRHPAIVG